ncbi:MAG TPA: hypothetical protein VGJ33_18660 [Candidatus Angelobacter sp.]
MKKIWIFFLLALIALAIWGCAHKTSTTTIYLPATPPPATDRTHIAANCPPNLSEEWQHVYNPDRLDVKEQCRIVTGKIEAISSEPDGDYHIRLKLDPGQESLLNPTNIRRQHGDLVIEPICEHKVSQDSAKDACKNFVGGVKKPSTGQHVKVAGSYVHDTEGGHGWMEIHPAVIIEEIP